MVEEMADLVIGRDAGHIASFWARAWRDINFLGHKGVPVVGISALDGALWDALGKMSNLPIYRILGGAQDRVPVYHSGWSLAVIFGKGAGRGGRTLRRVPASRR